MFLTTIRVRKLRAKTVAELDLGIVAAFVPDGHDVVEVLGHAEVRGIVDVTAKPAQVLWSHEDLPNEQALVKVALAGVALCGAIEPGIAAAAAA